jgi:hypothetical protein
LYNKNERFSYTDFVYRNIPSILLYKEGNYHYTMTEQKKRLLQAKIAAAHYTENLHMGVNFAPLCNLAQRLTQKARDTFGSQQAAIFGSSRG